MAKNSIGIALAMCFMATNSLSQELSDALKAQQIAEAQQAAAEAQAKRADTIQKALKLDTGSRAKFTASIQKGWDWINAQCSGTTITSQCAALAIEMASNQCAASAKFLKKDAKTWEILNIGLLISSAVFTGIGASPTLANAKIWSTLGGTTGLGAVTSSVNTNVTSDQTGLTSVNTALNDFITFVTTGATKGPAPPAILYIPSAGGPSGTVGAAFSYQIVASNSPTSYLVTNLPAPLQFSAATGLISGTPTAAGTASLTLTATNASGSGTATMTLTIAAAAPAAVPVITSPSTASGTVGAAFAYQIAANNSPTSYTATGPGGASLPAGLSVNATGLISGTPTSQGTSTVTLSATNATGTGTASMSLTISAAPAAGGSGPASNDLVFKVASLYGTRCTAAAMASSSK